MPLPLANPNQLLPAASSRPTRATGWLWIAACMWVLGFQVVFYVQTLPNNRPTTRLDVWQAVPSHTLELAFGLLDLFDPPPPRTQRVDGEPPPPEGLAYLPERLHIWLMAAGILLAAWAVGSLAISGLSWLTASAVVKAISHDLPLCLSLAIGVGLSLVSLLTLVAGATLGLSRVVLVGSLLVFCVVRIATLRRSPNKLSPPARPSLQNWKTLFQPIVIGPIALMLIGLVPMLFGATTPSVDFDVKEYHLGGPKEFFLDGKIHFLRHNVYTSFPFLTEMLLLLGMVVADDVKTGALVGQAVLFAFAPLTALGLFAAGRRYFSPAAGTMAALLYLNTPWTHRVSTIALAEGGLSCYVFLALLGAWLAAEARYSATALWLAGFFAGSAIACKYTGLVQGTLGVALVLAAGWWRQQRESAFSHRHDPSVPKHRVSWWKLGDVAFHFSVGVLLAIGPWLVKNTIETQNPVYPLANSVFRSPEWTAEMGAKWSAAHSPSDWNVAGIPGWIYDVAAVNDWQSPLLATWAPLALFWFGSRRCASLEQDEPAGSPASLTNDSWPLFSLLAMTAWVFLVWWAFTHRLDRFWVPIQPLLALLAGLGVAACWGSAPGFAFRKLFCVLIVAPGILFNFTVNTTGLVGYNCGLRSLAWAVDKAASLTNPEIMAINQEVRSGRWPSGKTLLVGEAQIFDAEFPVIYNTVFDDLIFRELTEGKTATEIRSRFQELGITHVIVNWNEVLRYRLTYRYDDYAHPSRFRELVNAGILRAHPWPEPLGQRRFKSLSSEEQSTIQNWAPELISNNLAGEQVFVSSQRYSVVE